MSLTAKRQKFVDAYCGSAKLNGTLAARTAGYADGSCSEEAYRLLRNAQIRDAIATRLEQYSMSTAEATERMAEWARGSLEPFMTADGHVDLSTEEAQFNLHLLKKAKITRRYSKDGDKLSETVEMCRNARHRVPPR